MPLALAVTITLVTGPGKVPLAPSAGAVNVTTVPGTGLPKASRAATLKGKLNAVLILAVCALPPVMDSELTGPGSLVSEKTLGVVNPGEGDVKPTLIAYEPAALLAVKVGAVAIPCALVTATTEGAPLGKVPLGPDAGAVKVAAIPGTGLPELS